MKYKLLSAVLLSVVIAGCGKQALTRPTLAFQKISTQGVTHFVYIKASAMHSEKNYLDISQYICDELKVCEVIFWDKRANVPFSLPLTDQQIKSQVAHYYSNETTNSSTLTICQQAPC